MKEVIKSFVLVAASAFAFTACQQEVIPSYPEEAYEISFVAGAPQTKTFVSHEGNEAIYQWSSGDIDRLFVYEVVDGVYKQASSIEAEIDDDTMFINAQFGGTTTPGAKYFAVLNDGVQVNQSSTDISYDQESDVLVSDMVANDNVENDYLVLSFKRETAFALMTAKGLAGEWVIGTSITADKVLAANFDYKQTAFEGVGSKTITNDVLSPVNAGVAPVFFATVPVDDATLSVAVVTGDEDGVFQAAYEKTFAKPISFTRGDVHAFGTSLTDNEVTSLSLDLSIDETTTASEAELTWERSFVSVVSAKVGAGTAANNYYPGKSNTSTRFYKGNTLTFTPKLGLSIKEIVYSATTDGYATTLVNSSWENATASATGGTVTIIPIDGTKAVSVTLINTTGADAIVVKYGIPIQPKVHSITIDSDIEHGSVSADPSSNVLLGTEVALTATPDENYRLASWNVTAGEEDIVVTDDKFYMPDCDVFVSATFELKPTNVATYTVNLNKDLYGVSVGSNGTEQSKTTTEDITVVSGCVSSANSKTYYDSGHIRYYVGSYLKVAAPDGKVITSIVFTEPTSGNKWEATDTEGISVNEGVYTNKTKTWSGSSEQVDFSFSKQCRAASIDVTVEGGSGVTKYTVSCVNADGGTLSANPARAEEGAEITLTATPSEEYDFNNDWAVKDESDNSVTVSGGKFTMPASNVTVSGSFSKKTYAITATPAENGTYSVKVGDADVTSACKGDKVTLVATPADGYLCDGWTVKQTVGGASVSVSNNSFTMPGAAVTITTTFSEKPADIEYDHAGTEIDPYSVQDVLKFIGTLGTATSTEDVYVKGVISSIVEVSTQYGNATYTIKDADDEYEMTVYRGRYIGGENFTSADQIAVGDEVVVKGKVKDYNGKKEFDTNNQLVSIKKAPFLKATASKTNNIAAAGEIITVSVSTNVDSWSAESDNSAFTISNKTVNSFQVVVGENTSTTDGRTAKVTVSASGLSNVVINLSQNKADAVSSDPFEWNGGGQSSLTGMDGVTGYGLGSDYAAANAPYQVKLDGTGDYIIIEVGYEIQSVQLKVKMIGGNSSSSIKIQEATSKSGTFTDVESMSISGSQNSVVDFTSTSAFKAESRAIKLYFTKGSNVGLGYIKITPKE